MMGDDHLDGRLRMGVALRLVRVLPEASGLCKFVDEQLEYGYCNSSACT